MKFSKKGKIFGRLFNYLTPIFEKLGFGWTITHGRDGYDYEVYRFR